MNKTKVILFLIILTVSIYGDKHKEDMTNLQVALLSSTDSYDITTECLKFSYNGFVGTQILVTFLHKYSSKEAFTTINTVGYWMNQIGWHSNYLCINFSDKMISCPSKSTRPYYKNRDNPTFDTGAWALLNIKQNLKVVD